MYNYWMNKANWCVERAKHYQENGDSAMVQFFKNAAEGFRNKAGKCKVKTGRP